MKRIILLALFQIVCFSNLFAAKIGKLVDVEAVKITEYGIYKSKLIKTPKDTNTVAGKVNVVKKGSVLKVTDTIPLELGLSFGVKYLIETNNDKTRKYPITYKVTYPREMVNPQSGKKEKQWIFRTYSTGNKPVYSGFNFSEDYEMLEGKWTFEFIVGKKSVIQEFYMEKIK